MGATGIPLGSTGILLGSTGILLRSIWDPTGVHWDPIRVHWDPIGIHWGPIGVHWDPTGARVGPSDDIAHRSGCPVPWESEGIESMCIPNDLWDIVLYANAHTFQHTGVCPISSKKVSFGDNEGGLP